MRLPSINVRRPAVLTALAAGAGLWAVAGMAVGAETAPQTADPAARTVTPGKKDSNEPAGVTVAPQGPRDPMEVLRERLEAKLGARRAQGSADSRELRLVATSSESGARRRDLGATPAPIIRPRQPRSEPALPPHWDYTGNGGPEAWARLKPEFAKCASGSRQSPIDIRDGIKVELEPVQFDYRPSAFRVIDNGHTVQVNVTPGNTIEVMGRRFELQQFHFHRPSEERIEGKPFDMVAHLVHKDGEGRLAVVAVLLERGSAQPVVQTIWNNLPLEKGDEVSARGTLNAADLLPAMRGYYTYMGSLTTPPCSEGVLWMVMKNPVPISADQLAIFARLYPMNARPVQAASGRLIKESN
jgi:carbonic anhydrase